MSLDADWQSSPDYLTSMRRSHDLIEAGLYMGNMDARHLVHDRVLHVDLVLSIATLKAPVAGMDEPVPLTDPALAVVEHNFPIADSMTLDETLLHATLDQTTAILLAQHRAAKKTVLVHCSAGVSRSATVLMDYLMTRDPELTFEDALGILSRARPCACPNPYFQRVLRARHALVTLPVSMPNTCRVRAASLLAEFMSKHPRVSAFASDHDVTLHWFDAGVFCDIFAEPLEQGHLFRLNKVTSTGADKKSSSYSLLTGSTDDAKRWLEFNL